MNKVTPFLWFDNQLEEAMAFYTSIFKNAEVTDITRDADGAVISAGFRLEGQHFLALNGGPHYKFTPAVSLFVNCDDQREIDDLWERLSDGGEPLRCGWITDRYGLTWQIVPAQLGDILQDDDEERSARVREAMLQMVKLDIKALEAAYAGES